MFIVEGGNLLELVENLHPDEGIEYQCLELGDFVFSGVVKDMATGEVKN